MIKEFLENNILLSDGAMGTYYSNLTGDSSTRVELSNILEQETIFKIHKEYIDAGAKLIRTNTFAANCFSLNVDRDKLKKIIQNGWYIAKRAAEGRDVFVTGDIGPIPTISLEGELIPEYQILEEYYYIIDLFLELGCTIFNFETFSSLEYLKEVTDYIKNKSEEFYIMVQFATNKSGFTRNGKNIEDIHNQANKLNVDLLGLNCGSGPTHLVKHIGVYETIYANAGYPEIINNRTIFNDNPQYYADVISTVLSKDIKIVGGCCGTTPEHIKALGQILNGTKPKEVVEFNSEHKSLTTSNKINKNLIIAVELDPPSKPDLKQIIDNSKIMKNIGVDYITLADSPSGRMRLNPIIVAARIKRDVGINVIPHICCRDRNLIALKSDILAAHTEGIRDILIITGDPVPLEERDEVKKVFNCNSVTLIKQVDQFNKTLLNDSILNIGGALNLSARNLESQEKRMNEKIEAGAHMFLTQPLYEDRSIDFLMKMKKPKDVKILAGILPVVTYKNAMFLNNEFPGISIPDNIISRFNPNMSRDEAEEVGIEISVEIANKLKGTVDGFYFMTPFNRTNMISQIIARAKLK